MNSSLHTRIHVEFSAEVLLWIDCIIDCILDYNNVFKYINGHASLS